MKAPISGSFILEDESIGQTDVVKSFSRGEWEAFSAAQQRQIFSRSNVHVKGKPAADILPDVSDLKSVEGLSRAIDLEKPLFCHGEFTIDNK